MNYLSFLGLTLCLLIAVPLTAQDAEPNLAARRVVQNFQDATYPSLTERLNAAAGTELTYEINWDELVSEGYTDLYEQDWPKLYFEPLIAAFTSLSADDIGKTALRDGLKKVVIRNTTTCYSSTCWASFADGVLTLDHQFANVPLVEDRTASLLELLEKSL
ncbi:hypothetical protein [Neolewinella antarctica]|uniref:Uncharacterized protein n=1 Tax=Neolewinella antarctica TaxID=442734 RepID=A0ABX0XG50_9BACT|nr:hypothetical protein [Neolewinella antarctica]NJC28197.1 hypothetical protein [Neolewinella antarctica]